MDSFCKVPNCYNSSKNTPQIVFFRFAASSKRQKEWIEALGLNNWKNIKPNTLRKYKICSNHFDQKFIVSGKGENPKLTFNAVPFKLGTSTDIIIEEKLIPNDEQQIIGHQNKNQDQNLTGNDNRNSQSQSQNSQLFNGHDQLYSYKCICNKRYQNYTRFKEHKEICPFQKKDLIICRIFRCHQTFTNSDDYEAHKLAEHTIPGTKKLAKSSWDSIGQFNCDHKGCTAKFQTKRKLYQHKRTVHVSRKYACLYCDLAFKKKAHKVEHELRIHHLKKSQNQAKIDEKMDQSQEFQVENELNIMVKVEENEINYDDMSTDQVINQFNCELEESGEKNCQNLDKNFENSQEFQVENEPSIDVKIEGIKTESDLFSNQIELDEYSECSQCYESFTCKMDAENHEKICQNLDKNLDQSQEFQRENEPNIKVKVEENDDISTNRVINQFDCELEESDEKNCQNFDKSQEFLFETGPNIEVKVEENEINYDTASANQVINQFDCELEESDEKSCQKMTIDNLKITCEYEDCNKVFPNIFRYNIHIDVVHLQLPKYRSQRKGARIIKEKEKELFNHNHNSCIFCGKGFKLKRLLKDHLKLPHTINCSKCPKIFVESEHLERHTRFNHLEELKKFQCPKCPSKFLKEIEVKKHDRAVHDVKMKICPICSNEINFKRFAKHLRRHNGGVWKSFCTSCHVYLANVDTLEKHYGTQLHLEKLAEKEEFILPHDLNLDINTVDSILIKNSKKEDEGIYDPAENAKKTVRSQVCQCPTCGVKFKNFHHREIHRVKFHGYQKPTCTLCNMIFSSKSNLTSHIKNSIHHQKIEEKEKELLTNHNSDQVKAENFSRSCDDR